MKNFNFLKRIEEKLHNTKGRRAFAFGSGPHADWKVICYLFGFLTTLTVLICVMVFIKIDKGEIFKIERTEIKGDKLLDVNLLREANAYYKTKKSEFERIVGDLVASEDSNSTTTEELISPFGSPE